MVVNVVYNMTAAASTVTSSHPVSHFSASPLNLEKKLNYFTKRQKHNNQLPILDTLESSVPCFYIQLAECFKYQNRVCSLSSHTLPTPISDFEFDSMRMSCNGCRVLRKGCSDDCSIKPCLQWITTPEAQANVTVFLAKFYGRAGLLNLINAGPNHLRPAVFRSLLYEACGRIVNPIYGPVGLLWSGNWQLCQEAVDCVLKGEPIATINSETVETSHGPPMKGCDIRHVTKEPTDLHKVKNRYRFKRYKPKSVKKIEPNENRAGSHESTVSHPVEPVWKFEEMNRETESALSSEAGSQTETVLEAGGFDLELSLGLGIY